MRVFNINYEKLVKMYDYLMYRKVYIIIITTDSIPYYINIAYCKRGKIFTGITFMVFTVLKSTAKVYTYKLCIIVLFKYF